MPLQGRLSIREVEAPGNSERACGLRNSLHAGPKVSFFVNSIHVCGIFEAKYVRRLCTLSYESTSQFTP